MATGMYLHDMIYMATTRARSEAAGDNSLRLVR
jgi:hypothetical protein